MVARTPIHVVFVHGLLSDTKVWAGFQRLIETDPELAGFVRTECFGYGSPAMRLRVDRRIPDIDDVADRLRTHLMVELAHAEAIVLVTHSQGGLIAQRFLARTLHRGEGRSLARIKQITMYACPNSGSGFLLTLRRLAAFWRHPQERQLRPYVRAVMESQQLVLRSVVNAKGCSDSECHIPIAAYSGMSDKIVPPAVAASVFPVNRVLDGDHFSVIRPADDRASSYRVLKEVLLTVAAESGPAGETTPEVETPAGSPAERQQRVSVTPPFGRREDAPLQGRAELIKTIMSSGEPNRVHVLAGLGGSGKSRLALEIAHRAAHRDGRKVWWISVPRINSCMREVAYQLGTRGTEIERSWMGSGSADLVWRLLDDSSEPWLLVFDNADDPRRLGPLTGPVSDGTGWLRPPADSRGMVLVTTRDGGQDTWGGWSVVHHVRPLDDEDGAAVLMERAGPGCGTYEQARALSAQLGGLPLALRAAADYVKSVVTSRVWSGEAAIRDFDGYREAVKRRFESPPGASDRDLSEPLGLEIVQGVFRLSLDLLAQRGLTQAAPLLKLFACLNVAPIPYHVLLAGDALADSPLFTRFTGMMRVTALEGLADLGLVELSTLDGVDDPDLRHVLSLHPLAHGCLRDDPEVRERRADYYGLNVRMLLAATDGLDPDLTESWVTWDVIAPHAIEVARATLLGGPRPAERKAVTDAVELARLTSRYLIMRGLLTPARDLLFPIIEDCGSFGCHEDDREILGLRHEKGRIALDGGDPAAAEEELRRVVAARTRILGENDATTLASRHKLAKAIAHQGHWGVAESLLRSIVLAENGVRGPEHSDTMVVRHTWARAILALGRAAEAEAMIRDILEVRYRLWSAADPETLFVRCTLARSLLRQNRPDEAEAEVQDALRVSRQRLDAPAIMWLRRVLIQTWLMQGRVIEARTDLERLLEDRSRVLGDRHPETARTRDMLARVREIPAKGEPPPAA